MVRPIVETNLQVTRHEPKIFEQFHYIAQYMEEGDGLNIRVGEYVIRTTVGKIEKVTETP